MLGLDNPVHLVFLLVLLLLVFGAKRLPEIGRSLGSGMRGFKESLSGDVGHTPELTQAGQAARVAPPQSEATQNGTPQSAAAAAEAPQVGTTAAAPPA